jgi:hypothetical protein
VNARRASFSAQPETEIAEKFAGRFADRTRTTPTALHLRAMNMLYEAIKEKGSMVIVPSSSRRDQWVSGGTLATASMSPNRPVVPS